MKARTDAEHTAKMKKIQEKYKDNPQVMHDVEEKFLKYYSVNQNNYEVSGHHYLPNPYVLEVDATE